MRCFVAYSLALVYECGTKVISEKFKTELEDLGYNCKRLEGKDRVETSFKIADEINELT